MKSLNLYYDTEFNANGEVIQLISIGIVTDDGREFYAESSEFDESTCNDFVKKEVLPKLGPKESRKTLVEIKKELLDFIGGDLPRFIAYVASYDHVVLCIIFGAMSDLPSHFPKYSWDVKQKMEELGIKRLPDQDKKGAHNALDDARWCKKAADYLVKDHNVVIPPNKKKPEEAKASLNPSHTLALVTSRYEIVVEC